MENKLKKVTKFEFLDSFRGFFAFTVVVGHFSIQVRPSLWDFTDWFHTLIGVFGFFVLSSFLLTYRLLSEFMLILRKTDKTTCDKVKLLISSVIKFTIRRFFRIYPLYISVVLFDKYFSRLTADGLPGLPANFWDILFIVNTRINLTWTIRVEMIYYFFIPFICLFASFCFKRCRILPVVMLTATCIYCEINWTTEKCGGNPYCLYIWFKGWFSAFLAGSLLAIIYYWVEDYALSVSNSDPLVCNQEEQDHSQKIFETILSTGVTKFLDIFCYFLFISFIILLNRRWGLLSLLNISQNNIVLFNYPAYHWCLVLFLALLSRGSFANLLNNRFWNHAGKISFSIYLIHMIPLVNLKKIMNFSLFQGFEGFTIFFFLFMFSSTITYHLIEYPGMWVGTKLCRLVDKCFGILSV